MILTKNAHYSDRMYLTLWDIIKIIWKKDLRLGGGMHIHFDWFRSKKRETT